MRAVTLVFPGGGIGPPAQIDETKVLYVFAGLPPGAPPAGDFTDRQVSTCVSHEGTVVTVLGYHEHVAELLFGTK